MKICAFLIFWFSMLGVARGADAEILIHVSTKMLLSTQIPNFIEIGAFFIYFPYKLERG